MTQQKIILSKKVYFLYFSLFSLFFIFFFLSLFDFLLEEEQNHLENLKNMNPGEGAHQDDIDAQVKRK